MSTRWLSLLFLSCCMVICTACSKNESQAPHSSTLRISTEGDPQTLDPRRVRDLPTATVIHMLYEGLMRNQEGGKLEHALAESVTVSPDQKTYTFKLRQSAWSDGQTVTAQDFEKSWKSQLDPKFPSPNAYQLYVIQGAQEAKEGRAPIEQVGVQATDSSTLVVQLVQPTPYFLQLTATHFFYPVHTSLRKEGEDAKALDESSIVTNGPFQLKKWNRHNELVAVPNPHYWDRRQVRLDAISFIVLDNPTALQLYQRGELEWTGSPLSTISTDALASLRKEGLLNVAPAAGTYLLRVNTENPILTSAKMRQALAFALNRTDLVEHVLQGNQVPAFGIVPPSFINGEPYFQDHDLDQARQLLQEALDDAKLSLKELPAISIYYASGERAHKIAQVAQQQWKEGLGIEVNLQSSDGKVYFDRLKKHDYQIGIGSWFADFRDPISFLEIFKLKANGTNNTQWESPRYINLLDQSAQATDELDWIKLLKEAERVIIEEMPVIPLFYGSYNYVKHPAVKGVYFSELGYLDFKQAYMER